MTSMKLIKESLFSDICQHGQSVMSCCKDSMLQALYNVLQNKAFTEEAPITIADFGTADGSVAILILNELIDLIRKECGERKDIVIIFEDQVKSNFNALVKVTTNGLERKQKPVLNIDDHVFLTYSATSMYKRCFPKDSLDLVLSTMSLMFLSKLPCNIKNGIFNTEASLEEQTLFKTQSAEDYKKFLVNRGEELRHGGKMVIGFVAQFPDGRISSPIQGGCRSLGEILGQLLHLGLITQVEYENITCQVTLMLTEDDLRQPFQSNDEDIIRLGLAIESLKFKETIYAPSLDNDGNDEFKVIEYAETIVGSIKPWLFNTFYDGLDKARQDKDKHHIIEAYFDLVLKFIKSQKHFPPHIIRFAEIVITKN